MNDDLALEQIRQHRSYSRRMVERYVKLAAEAAEGGELDDAGDYAQLAVPWLPAFVQSISDEAALRRGRAK